MSQIFIFSKKIAYVTKKYIHDDVNAVISERINY